MTDEESAVRGERMTPKRVRTALLVGAAALVVLAFVYVTFVAFNLLTAPGRMLGPSI
jgi:hypothetical protein